MKYLCLAYGSERDWNAMSKEQQDGLLQQDEVLRRRGDVVAAVGESVTTLRAPDGVPKTTKGTVGQASLPLAGFSIVEADSLDEAVRLVADTPCARANGAIEIREIAQLNDVHLEGSDPDGHVTP